MSSRKRQIPKGVGYIMVLGCLGVAIMVGKLAFDGLATDETFYPSRRGGMKPNVVRAHRPILFWSCVTLYSTLSIGLGVVSIVAFRDIWRQEPEEGYPYDR